MRLNPAAFNRFMEDIGQRINWRSSFACSCFSPSSGAADPKCRLCLGKGRIWDPAVDTVCGVCKQDTQAEWADNGLWEAGDLVVTIPGSSPMWDAGQFDRVTMLNASDKFSQPLTRGAPTERLLFQPVRIDRVFWRDPDTHAAVAGGMPVVSETGQLSWPAGGEPPLGTSYSLTGWKRSEYYVFGDFPANRNMHQGARLPKRVVLRRWDLFGR